MALRLHGAVDRASLTSFTAAVALLFAVSVVATICGALFMSSPDMRSLPGEMSMMWMPMPGQQWTGIAAAFLAMWVVMMVAMMLPSLAPILWRYHCATGGRGLLTTCMALGYFTVWSATGLAVFALGACWASLQMQVPLLAQGIPAASGLIVLGGGLLQFTAWKARHLACCRRLAACRACLPMHAGAAFGFGLRRGVQCTCCCAGLTGVLLVAGSMDLKVMAAVTAAITVERLAPLGLQAARLIGWVTALAGAYFISRALIG